MTFYAHSNDQGKETWQTVIAHLEGASALASTLGEDAGVGEFAAVAALLHDVGKYSQAFQRRIEGAAEKVDHATAGAKEATQIFSTPPLQKVLGEILAYCIAGHHGGLPDYGSPIDVDSEFTLHARLKREVKDYHAYAAEVDRSCLALPTRLPIQLTRETAGFSLSVLTRMIYSTLVDADFLDTETFVNGGKKPRGDYANIATLWRQFAGFLQQFDQPQNAINQRRTETLKTCVEKASDPPGLFTLTLPTGGGKTLASMAFALNHAVRHGLKRIIYVIPYTSIIEQNAAVFKNSLGELRDNVLEHHSNFDLSAKKRDAEAEEDADGNALVRLKLASENWDIPIVVTTSVQFFESFYANRSSRSRKVHNLSKSVILFDEAQMLPRPYLKPCLYAVTELVRNYGSSVVFCTATQPCIGPFLPDGAQLKELIPNPQEHFDFYRRVRVVNQGKLSDAALLDRLNQHEQALCIVNTRKHARGLYEGLQGEGCFHLSTLMCATHRSEVIAEIRRRLKEKQPCRVVSTQLLEAGVDLDFPVGYRALAGLESIIQSAGRVNREGLYASGDLFVFEPESENAKRAPAYIRQAADVARLILGHFPDPVCIEAIQAYYAEIYNLQDPKAFDAQKILDCFEKGGRNPDFDFQTAAERFKLIEDDTTGVIIPFDETAKSLLRDLRVTPYPNSVLRKLQPYMVNIFEPEYQALANAGSIELYCDQYPVLREEEKEERYSKETGLLIPDVSRGQGIYF